MKNVVILLETQQRLRQVSLPPISGPTSIRLIDYAPTSSNPQNLRDLEVQSSANTGFDAQIHAMVRELPSLEQLHLRCSSTSKDRYWNPAARGGFSRRRLFDVATKLTIHSYCFNLANMYIAPKFPALRAMAIVDCAQIDYFLAFLRPENCPHLIALMLKSEEYISASSVVAFVGKLHGVREFILESKEAWISDGAPLVGHAESLQLLSLHTLTTSGQLMSDVTLKLILFMDSAVCSMNTKELRRLDGMTIKILVSRSFEIVLSWSQLAISTSSHAVVCGH
jgi:hypothetical protein